MPIASHAVHVNGVPDVAFDTANPVVYNASGGVHTYSLASATYEPSTKTCSDVACHYNPNTTAPPGTPLRWQKSPRWGSPYRWYTYSAECDLCHRYGNLSPTCTPAP